MENNDNIKFLATDGILQENGESLAVSQTDATHYTAELAGTLGAATIPNLSRNGNLIRNTARPIDMGGWNMLDFIMLSDGTNRAFAMIGQEKADATDISLAVSSWSSFTGSLKPEDFVGTWNIESYGDANLLNAADGFEYQAVTLAIQQSDANHLLVTLPGGGALSLRVEGNEAFLEAVPVISGTARYHTFCICTDGQKLSIQSVASELNDWTDVSVTLGLGARQTVGGPAVITGGSSALTATTSILNGTVTPNGLATTAQFEYGLTTSYGSAAGVTLSPNNGTMAQSVSVSIGGLEAGQTYHYRLTATNSAGPGLGWDLTFTTAVAPPFAVGELVAPGIAISGGNVNFTVHASVAGRVYQLQCSDSMVAGTWQNLGTVWVGDGNELVISTPHDPLAARRFYRLVLSALLEVPSGFAVIPAGSFQMGDQSNPPVGGLDESPVHSVQASTFFMGKFEITKEEWDVVRTWGMANGYTDLPIGGGKGPNYPVNSISWHAAAKWCNARSQKEGLTPCYTVSSAVYKTGDIAPGCDWNADGYRLPTEAEWEMAARGKLRGQNFPWGNTITHSQANYNSTTSFSYDVSPTRGYHPTYYDGVSPYSSPVGSFAPNGYGLYDMAGNLWEWCWDWYGAYAAAAQTNPLGADLGSHRVLRGGSWYNTANGSRVAVRDHYAPSLTRGAGMGFRVARGLATAPTGFAVIPGGSFNMGDPLDGLTNAPPHTVNVSAFYMQKKGVTKAEWDAVRAWGMTHGYTDLVSATGAGKAMDHPVQTVSWYDVVKWCNARSELEGLTPCYYIDAAQTAVFMTGSNDIDNTMVKWTANGHRLPTEAEREKAARGGLADKRYPWGDDIGTTEANYGFAGNPWATGASPFTSPAGSFPANDFGLYDMAGNLSEWCWDWYGTTYYASSPGIDPTGPVSGSRRVLRGGSSGGPASGCRVAFRSSFLPLNASSGMGFRPVRRQ